MSIFDTLKKGKEIFVDAREQMGKMWEPLSPVDSAEEINQSRLQSVLPSEVKRIQREQAMSQGMIPLGDSYVDPLFSGGMKKIVGSTVKNVVAPAVAKSNVFGGFNDLSTHVLEKLKGVGDTSERFILDTMQNVKGKIGLKQPEQNIYTNALFDTVQNGRVNANDFANRVKQDLLPLTTKTTATSKNRGPNAVTADYPEGLYERVSLPSEQRGNVADYSEHIYESPVPTSAGDVHFGSFKGVKNYFGHTRIEDMDYLPEGRATQHKEELTKYVADLVSRKSLTAKQGEKYLQQLISESGPETSEKVRRVIEVQSDLFQKGKLDNERTILPDYAKARMTPEAIAKSDAMEAPRNAELDKLEPYKNIWHERLIREEVKQAAVDGKTKLQFPTGETAMKIEGLGERNNWNLVTPDIADFRPLKPEDLKVGQQVADGSTPWIITDILGDGKFKAVTKSGMDTFTGIDGTISKDPKNIPESAKETFDISGNLNRENPIYKFYESEVGKYLQKKYDAKMKIDDNGVTWWEVDVNPEVANQPVKAFGGLAIPAGVKSLFEDQQQSQTNPDGSTSSMSIPSPIKSLFGAKMEYNRTDAPAKQEQAPAPTVTAPKVIETVTDIHGPYDTLETGTTVRPVREKLKSAIEQAYASAPTIDRGVIEAILMKESSMGTNPANRNLDIGKYAWLVGFTKIAKAELIRNNIVPDLDTPEGAIRALAQYWDLRDDKYATSTEAYNQHYSSGKLKPEQLQEFDDMVKYYQSHG